jgi:positive phototaxis protein PixI
MMSNGTIGEAEVSSRLESKFEKKVEMRQFIEFQIDDVTLAAFEAEVVLEVLSVKAKSVVPVPNMPSSVLGLMSRRGRVYWTIDLAMMLGLQPLNDAIEQFEVLILDVENLLLAVAVRKIKGKVTVDPTLVSTSMQSCPNTLKSYVKGCMTLPEREEVRLPRAIYVLKADAIARSGILHS